jgi:hypothetical protein
MVHSTRAPIKFIDQCRVKGWSPRLRPRQAHLREGSTYITLSYSPVLLVCAYVFSINFSNFKNTILKTNYVPRVPSLRSFATTTVHRWSSPSLSPQPKFVHRAELPNTGTWLARCLVSPFETVAVIWKDSIAISVRHPLFS